MKPEESAGKIFDGKTLRGLMRFLKPYKVHFYTLVALTFLVAIMSPIRPLLISYTIDNHVAAGNYTGLLNMTLLMLGLLVIQSLMEYASTYLSGWLGQTIIRDIRIKLYNHLISFRLKFFDQTPIGRLITRNISDVETISEVFSTGVANIAGEILQVILILAVMFYIDWELTLISLSTLPILIISTYIFKEKIKVSFNDVRSAVSKLNTFVQEHLTGMNVVQLFTAEDRELAKFKAINKEHRKANLNSVLYYSIYVPVAEVIAAAGTGLMVWYGAGGVLEGRVTEGTLVAFIMYISMFFRPIRQIADRFNTLQLGIVSADRVLKLLDDNEQKITSGTAAPQNFTGKVDFEHVWFAYNEPEYVLKDVSFSLQEGKTMAMVGATGAGKSSVINLINRFYDIQKGSIKIDGIDIKDFDLDELRSHVGLVLQDVFLFSGSIRDNITLYNTGIDDAKIEDAARQVGAWDFIQRLPGGLDYNVMERGATLSVGQRQLISFIRALAYDPKLLILDEATSSVDTETEELIQKAIEKMMKGRTTIVIAHRLSTIRNADTIVVMDHGEIKETGTHEELLAMDGFYANLHRMQYKEAV